MKRSSYHQVMEWNERRGSRLRLGPLLVTEINSIDLDAASIAKNYPTFLEFIPIRLVTTLEVFLRGVVSELVNGKGEYFERGEKLAKGAKIDLTFAAHVDRRELTIGDFVAHCVSLNSVAAVLSALDTLLGDFTAKLKVAHARWSEDAEAWPLPPIIDNYDMMVASLVRLYEIRHVLAHELPQAPVLDPEEVPHLLTAAKMFITATDWVVVEALHGAVPRTQTAMNLHAGNDLHQEEARLAETLNEVTELVGINADALHAVQNGWAEWADAQAALVASQVEGGSMYPMMWASEKLTLTRERRDQLIRLKSEWLNL